MKTLQLRLNRIYTSEAGRFAFGAAAALLLYAVALLLQPVITFYDNDDLNIAWALAGYRSGTPSFSHPFLNPLMAAFVSALYTLIPAVPWWYAVQTGCMLLSIALTAACVLKICARNGLPFLVPCMCMALLGGGAYYYAIAQVMFTLTSTVLGMAACALVLAVDAQDAPARRRGYWAASVCLLALSLLVRQSSGLCAACFYFGCLAYRFFAPLRRAAAITGTCAAAVLCALVFLNAWGRANQNPQGFLAFENARAEFMDYPHDQHYENPALYESIGWSESLYGLVDAWFYMDVRVNADTLATASEQAHAHDLTTAEQAERAREALGTFLQKYPIARYLTLIALSAALTLIAAYFLGNRAGRALGFGVCLLLGACALAAFLLWRGRMNLRTWMTVLYPAILTVGLLGAEAYASGGQGLRRRAALGAICCLLAVPALFCGYKIFRTVASYDSREALSNANAVVDYAMAHPDNVYIRDVYAGNNYDALRVFPAQKPVNLIDWGGCDMYTRARLAQWRANGRETSPFADVFLDDDVYYICDVNDRYLPMLAAYMEAEQGASGYETVALLQNGLAVVRFLP